MTAHKDDIFETVQRQFACEHNETKIRKKTDKAGRLMLAHQCVRCGQQQGSYLSPKDFTAKQIEAFELWDKTLETKHSKDKSETLVRLHTEEKAQLKRDFLRRHSSYLKSEIWKKLRQKILNRSNHICEGCGEAAATQVHHMNYERWEGNELLIDLLAVCAECHRKLHPKDQDIINVLIDSKNLPQNNRGAFFEMQLPDVNF